MNESQNKKSRPTGGNTSNTNVDESLLLQHQQTGPKQIIKKELISFDGPPLDFSYKHLTELKQIKITEPRKGKRKPIVFEEEEIKEDKKPQQEAVEKVKDQAKVTNTEKEASQAGENGEEGEAKENEEKEAVPQGIVKKDEKGPEVIRVLPQNTINAILQQNNVQFSSGQQVKNAQGKTQQGQHQFLAKKVLKVNKICCSLILSYNSIPSLINFYKIISDVMIDCSHLQWIDLQHNMLANLDYDFIDFPQLKSLYLHCNELKDLKCVIQLQHLKELRSLTIHGNPIETIPNFRLYIIGALPQMKTLDTVVVSNKERDNALVWINQFNNFKFPVAVDRHQQNQMTTAQQQQSPSKKHS